MPSQPPVAFGLWPRGGARGPARRLEAGRCPLFRRSRPAKRRVRRCRAQRLAWAWREHHLMARLIENVVSCSQSVMSRSDSRRSRAAFGALLCGEPGSLSASAGVLAARISRDTSALSATASPPRSRISRTGSVGGARLGAIVHADRRARSGEGARARRADAGAATRKESLLVLQRPCGG